MSQLNYKHWCGSALIHGSAVALLVLMQWSLSSSTPKKITEWDVSLLQTAVEQVPEKVAVAPEAAEPAPALKLAPVVPLKPKLAAPTRSPAPIPTPNPSPTPPTEPAPTPPLSPLPPPQVITPPEKPFADGAWLNQTVWGLMNGRKRYPLVARRMGVEGKVVIEAIINDQGQIVKAEIKQSSGSPFLDQDALALLKSVTPLKIDKYRLAPNTPLVIPVTYALEN